MKIALFLMLCLLVLIVAFVMGPRMKYKQVSPAYPVFDKSIADLSQYIQEQNSKVTDMKPGCESEIIWAQEADTETEYVLLYLHGFSATKVEGDPVHKAFAERYGMNLYLPLLEDHGRSSDDSFKDLTPVDYMESAKEAVQVAKLLGEKLIIMGCSTGATLAAYLAAHDEEIESLLFFSPNMALVDPMSRFLTWPWSQQLLRRILKGEHRSVTYGPLGKKFWNPTYHMNGLISLKSLLDQTMTQEVFREIEQPTFVGCYYQDEENQDPVVSVPAMQDFMLQIQTPSDKKRFVKFANAKGHVFSSYVNGNQHDELSQELYRYAEEVLGLRSI